MRRTSYKFSLSFSILNQDFNNSESNNETIRNTTVSVTFLQFRLEFCISENLRHKTYKHQQFTCKILTHRPIMISIAFLEWAMQLLKKKLYLNHFSQSFRNCRCFPKQRQMQCSVFFFLKQFIFSDSDLVNIKPHFIAIQINHKFIPTARFSSRNIYSSFTL